MLINQKHLSADALGEFLREYTFAGEGYGCYTIFDVREDAIALTPEERMELVRNIYPDYYNEDLEGTLQDIYTASSAYAFEYDDYNIIVFWWWDGDGTLAFIIRHGEDIIRAIFNDDCKKSYGWTDRRHGWIDF